MNIYEFMGEHWLLTLCLAMIAANAFHAALFLPYRFYRRACRRRNIKEHGWPTTPLMDADGDIVFPKTPDSDGDSASEPDYSYRLRLIQSGWLGELDRYAVMTAAGKTLDTIGSHVSIHRK